jgi:hypothetical protein
LSGKFESFHTGSSFKIYGGVTLSGKRTYSTSYITSLLRAMPTK